MAQKFAIIAVAAASLVIVRSGVVVAQSAGNPVQPSQSDRVNTAPMGSDTMVPGAPGVTVGRSIPTADGIGTKTVPARPCTTSARETDGKTTCIGVPAR